MLTQPWSSTWLQMRRSQWPWTTWSCADAGVHAGVHAGGVTGVVVMVVMHVMDVVVVVVVVAEGNL